MYSAPPRSQFTNAGARAGRIREVIVTADSGVSQLELVRACIDLGQLLPPDVAVEISSCGDDGTASPERGAWRMWTARSLANGFFIFEAHVPNREIRRGGLLRFTVRRTADGTPGQILDSRFVIADQEIA